MQKDDPSNKIIFTETNSDSENNLETWKNYTPETLKKPLDNALLNKKNSIKKISGEQQKPRNSSQSWVNRRRPVAGVLHGLQSSHLAHRYTELAKLKLEMARIQLEILKTEQVSKLKEDQFKQSILEVELEIKKKQLLLLNRSSF